MELDTDSTHASLGGVFNSAKHLLASIVEHLHTRLALFSTEFAEEKLRLTTLLYSALTALFFFFMTLILALLFVIAAYWDTPYRLHAIGGLTALFLIGAGIAWSRVRAQLQSRPRLFEASLAELYKDRQQLDSQ
ncbi:MAG: phage holin family protein [Burkholderiales bacterium]|nr:phage holin family protein [Burkholderiales bacterium]